MRSALILAASLTLFCAPGPSSGVSVATTGDATVSASVRRVVSGDVSAGTDPSEWRPVRGTIPQGSSADSRRSAAECFLCQGLFDTVFHRIRRQADMKHACRTGDGAKSDRFVKMCHAFLVRYGPALAAYQNDEQNRSLCTKIDVCADDMNAPTSTTTSTSTSTTWSAASGGASPSTRGGVNGNSNNNNNNNANTNNNNNNNGGAGGSPPKVFRGPHGPRGDKGEAGREGQRGPAGPMGTRGGVGEKGARGASNVPPCPMENKRVCGGRGRCDLDLGRCVCNAKWDGPVCQKERRAAVCSTDGDPHWNTFDGQVLDFYEEGEFLQYRNPIDRLGPNERVTSAFSKCNNGASCVSDVMLARGKDVLRVTRECKVHLNCAPADLAAGLRAGKPVTTPSGITVSYDAGRSKFTAASPSGLKLSVACGSVSAFGLIMTLEINEAPIGSLQGMCGNYNLSPFDDVDAAEPFFPSWVSRWSVPKEQALLSCGAERGKIGEVPEDMLAELMDADIKGQLEDHDTALTLAGVSAAAAAEGSGDAHTLSYKLGIPDKNCVRNANTGCCVSHMESAVVMCGKLRGNPAFRSCTLDCCINLSKCPLWVAFDTIADTKEREAVQSAIADDNAAENEECNQELAEGAAVNPKCRPNP